MAKDFAKGFYASDAWQKCRAGYISSIGGICERCAKQGIISPAFIVHHKIYLSADNITDPNVSLAWENLEALCLECHNKEHMSRKKRYRVDESGRVIINE